MIWIHITVFAVAALAIAVIGDRIVWRAWK